MKNRILSLLALCLVATAGVWSAPVSRRDAKAVAGSFLQGRGHQLKHEQPAYRALRKGSPTTSVAEEEAYYYVFNADGGQGYVIVSGDDRTEQVLGYSDTGSFPDADALPGEETLLGELNSESELNINNGGNTKVQEIIEHGFNQDKDFDDIMADWNEAWSDAQKALNVEVK